MTLNQLHYFRTVCRFQSVTRAAENLHVSQPSVSNAIKDLEAEYGVTLFRRVNKSMVLTPDGQTLLDNVDTLLDLETSLTQKMYRYSMGAPPLRIGIPPMIGVVIFPKIFAEYKQQNPGATIEISEYGSFQTVQMVQKGQLDLAITITDNIDGKQINVLPLMTTHVVLATHPENPLAAKHRIGYKDIGGEPLILFKPDYYLHHLLMHNFGEAGFKPNVLLHTNQLYTMRNFILNRSASAFVFRDLLEFEEDIAAVELEQPLEIGIGLIWKQGASLSQSASQFLSFARKRYDTE